MTQLNERPAYEYANHELHGQPESATADGVRKKVKEAVVVNMIPEKVNHLRLEDQSQWLGTLKYSAIGDVKGGVRVTLKVELPPDQEEVFVINLTQSALHSVSDLKELLRQTVVDDYIFQNHNKKDGQERKGLNMTDINRFDDMARDIVDVFKED